VVPKRIEGTRCAQGLSQVGKKAPLSFVLFARKESRRTGTQKKKKTSERKKKKGEKGREWGDGGLSRGERVGTWKVTKRTKKRGPKPETHNKKEKKKKDAQTMTTNFAISNDPSR